MLKEFKEFALKGNVMDMAVGVVIGGAFGKIVASLVEDIIMPFVSGLIGGVDFTHLSLVLTEGTEDAPGAEIMYGNFIQTTLDFIIIAFAIFLAIKAINRMRRKSEEVEEVVEEPETPVEVELLTEIRDLLKK